MANGTVRFFKEDRGYGFIETDANDEDVFFHMDDVEGGDLTVGAAVTFDIETAPRGPRAKNVKLV